MGETDLSQLFGLTLEQTRILFSLEYLLVEEDIKATKSEKKIYLKKKWAFLWKNKIEQILVNEETGENYSLYTSDEIDKAIHEEDSKQLKQTWYHLVLLELLAFVPYSSLKQEDEDRYLDKEFAKLRFSNQKNFIRDELTINHNIVSPETVDRYYKSYNKALNKGLGKNQKIINRSLIVIASSAVVAASAGAFAPLIAVGIKGSAFAGLSGAALVSASLAALGGGAVAIGGGGMAAGLFTIVGGGALLGGLAGTSIVTSVYLIAQDSPDIVISQGAKLSVVLKEIVLNEQKDIMNAQEVLAEMKNQILEMNNELNKLRLERETDKLQIKNLAYAIKGLEALYHDNMVFESSFEIGLENNG